MTELILALTFAAAAAVVALGTSRDGSAPRRTRAERRLPGSRTIVLPDVEAAAASGNGDASHREITHQPAHAIAVSSHTSGSVAVLTHVAVEGPPDLVVEHIPDLEIVETPPLPSRTAHRRMERKRHATPVVHPLLFAAFPILSLFAANLNEVSSDQIWAPLLVSLAAAVTLVLVAWPIFRSLQRAGLIASILLLLFFTYGRVYEPLQDVRIAGFRIGRNQVLFPIWCLIGGGAALAAIRARAALPKVTKALNAVAFVLVLTTLITIGTHRGGSAQAFQAPLPVHSEQGIAASTGHEPDIYYIVLDRYAGNDALRHVFGYDNRDFLNQLRRMGFYVATGSRPNYPNTTLSLASSLNMDYLDEMLTRRVGERAVAWKAAFELFKRTAVARYLKARGYTYLNVGTWWEPTRRNPLADVNYVYDPLSEFSRVLLQTTAAWPIAQQLGADRVLDPREAQWNRVHFQLEVIEESRRKFPGPTFLFAHFTLPHDPYVFADDGAYQSAEQEHRKNKLQAYVDQLRYTNTRILQLVRKLMSGPESERPVILLQSDEGPSPVQIGTKPRGWTWSNATEREVQTKFRNLGAYYLPGIENPGLYPTITPVNSFRLVFNLYFNAGFPLRRDRSYIFPDWGHLYKFVDVTERVRTWPPEADVRTQRPLPEAGTQPPSSGPSGSDF